MGKKQSLVGIEGKKWEEMKTKTFKEKECKEIKEIIIK